jgi:N-acetylglucosaminyl-diphospho-decaprenol L-rhamnosyltransferase
VARRSAAAGPAAAADTRGSGMALVTVTHNSAGDLPRLLGSIARHLPGARTIVVDSGSVDGSARLARTLAPRATVIELGENVGFGSASNTGVAQADAPVTALVNPDVELLDGSLGVLGRELLDPGVPDRILAPLVLSADGSRQDTAQLDPSSPLMLVRALLPPAALPHRLRVELDPWLADEPRRVGWGVGCCLVARTKTLRRLGPFDQRIFLFAEDLDLGLRAADAGVETWFRPDARIVHLDARSTEPVFGGEPFELLARQRRAVIGELRGVEAAQRDQWIWLVTFAGRIAVKALTLHSTARERRQLAAQWAARGAPARLA